ncbi:Predicted amidohydrolase [Pustulibacterium marinum]|uniref:Omega-amidase YafV n=1 Tax=Pustulibacterium marinum TaxID=1224947 RepID=A0A1I7HCU1_9FLAO|nr:amidohydrolase [Pustulibacterium marinum]SFU58286.1 Predicted amidohydrolase [Pustulibacterium marinum]
MMNSLKIAIVQTDLIWEAPQKNLENLYAKISNAEKADVYVLPEMFTTGFTMNAKQFAESMEGVSVAWMKNLAREKQSVICGSLIINEEENYYNRFVWVLPSGEVSSYNKRHTFTLAGEHKVYQKGEELLLLDYKGWKICPLICYDLRFPVWARNTKEYDVLLYVANWPQKRIQAWDALLKARAIENMSYVVGVNRVGKDGNQIPYNGHSAIYNELGEQLIFSEKEEILMYTLEKSTLEASRNHFKFLDDQDDFSIHI